MITTSRATRSAAASSNGPVSKVSTGLWESEAMVPTPNELAAPGLWLARIELETHEP